MDKGFEMIFDGDMKKIKTEALFDMLVTYTTLYTSIMNEGGSAEDFLKCKKAILRLQAEIDNRQRKINS